MKPVRYTSVKAALCLVAYFAAACLLALLSSCAPRPYTAYQNPYPTHDPRTRTAPDVGRPPVR